jgi:hypothetical protein
MERIVSEGVIRTGAYGAVFCEGARRRPLPPHDAEERYGLRYGRGRDYVEIDVPDSWLERRTNERTGVEEWLVRRNIPLDRSATIVRRR